MCDRSQRRVVVPDLDDQLYVATATLNEALWRLVASHPPHNDPDPLPGGLHRGDGPGALTSLRQAIHMAPPITLLGSDDVYEHEPVRVVDVAVNDLRRLDELLATLRRVVYETGYHGEVDEFLNRVLSDYPDGPNDTGEALTVLARFHGVLDLDNSAEMAVLDNALEYARSGFTSVALNDTEEWAYGRLRDRWLAMWHDHIGHA